MEDMYIPKRTAQWLYKGYKIIKSTVEGGELTGFFFLCVCVCVCLLLLLLFVCLFVCLHDCESVHTIICGICSGSLVPRLSPHVYCK